MPEVFCKNWGVIPYDTAWEKQRELLERVLSIKRSKKNKSENYLVFCEHPHVYTLGRSGKEQNLLLNHLELVAKNATFVKVDRGGDITYHGPGQIVGYPILDLSDWGIGVKEYIYRIEKAIIELLAIYDIVGTRREGATGVWLDVGTPRERKIAAIGVKVSHHVTMHGLALNVNTDLKYFNYINPCGFIDKGVTSLQIELGRMLDIETIRKQLQDCIATNFEMHLIDG